VISKITVISGRSAYISIILRFRSQTIGPAQHSPSADEPKAMADFS